MKDHKEDDRTSWKYRAWRRARSWFRAGCPAFSLTVVAIALGGCDSISIQPSCPVELAVGESGTVAANEQNPGAIPNYLWQVFPPDAGTFTDPQVPVTEFTALKEGEVVIRLTAGDGIYQVVSACTTHIEGQINGNVNDNDNGNANDNGNHNDNTNDNINDNTGGGGGRR